MIKKVESPSDIAYVIKYQCRVFRCKGTSMYRISIERFRQMSISEVANLIVCGVLYYELEGADITEVHICEQNM